MNDKTNFQPFFFISSNRLIMWCWAKGRPVAHGIAWIRICARYRYRHGCHCRAWTTANGMNCIRKRWPILTMCHKPQTIKRQTTALNAQSWKANAESNAAATKKTIAMVTSMLAIVAVLLRRTPIAVVAVRIVIYVWIIVVIIVRIFIVERANKNSM